VLLQFILALGNRPKGSRKSYIASFCVFGIIQVYALILAFYLVFRAFSQTSGWNELYSGSALGLLKNLFLTNTGLIILALASTWGLYFLSSIMYLDPWHMLHSFLPYMLMASSYTNVLNVYAFCNWHDVSWGTKGSDQASALPSAKTTTTGQGERVVEEEVNTQHDIDTAFEKVVKRCLKPLEVHEEIEQKSLDDSYKSFRTRLIIAWILTNTGLIVVITSSRFDFLGIDARSRTAGYFRFILLSTAVLAFFRFMGCCWFLGRTFFCGCFQKK